MSQKIHIRKISKKSKYSYCLSLPKEIMGSLNWRNKQKLEVKMHGKNKILITDWHPKKTQLK
ncbi:hypothetical protein ACFL23_04205 [Patescibacteria group bacterium]